MTTPGSFSAVEIPRACLFNSYELAITGLSSLVISYVLHLGRFPFVRTGRPNHGRASQIENEIRFSKSFCWKRSPS